MTLIEHLTELRRRLIISAIALAVGASIAFLLYNPILAFLSGPYHAISHGNKELIVTDPLEAFATRLKIAAGGGGVLASPVLLWRVWGFLPPGLNPKGKAYALPLLAPARLL